jgi:phytoene dehydrogenase-like protein
LPLPQRKPFDEHRGIRRIERAVEVAVIGAGPAGLAAAAKLAGTHRRLVLMLERETTAGGIPRQCGHLGYGIRDLHTVITGPDYGERLLHHARGVGARSSPTQGLPPSRPTTRWK